MKYLMLLICFGCVFFTSQIFGDSRSENSAKESACQGYHEEFIELVEMVYGKGFLSQGSNKCIDQMVSDLQLDNATVLDIGCGLGAPALYLAQQHKVNLTGIDAQAWMIERANQSLKEIKKDLKGSVEFLVSDDPSSLKQFPSCSFDIVFSKETILHIPLEIKEDFFKEIYRVLKPGGEIVIMDWLHSSPNYSESTKKMMEMDGVAYNLQTPSEYLNILENAGFTEVRMENRSEKHAAYSQENIETIQKLSSEIQAKFGNDVYEYCLESWACQRNAFQSEEIITAILKAKKE